MMKLQVMAVPLALGLSIAGVAHAQSKVELQVVGNLGITTQYKELEQPFWTKQIPEATGGRVTASIKPWNEMGLKGPEVFRMLGQGVFDVGTSQLGFVAGDNAINDATDLAGVSPDIETFWKVTQAFRPNLERYYEQQLKVKPLDPGSPLDLAQARNAVELARFAGADRYASETFAKASALLAEAEVAREKGKRGNDVQQPARQAAQEKSPCPTNPRHPNAPRKSWGRWGSTVTPG